MSGRWTFHTIALVWFRPLQARQTHDPVPPTVLADSHGILDTQPRLPSVHHRSVLMLTGFALQRGCFMY